MPMLWQCITLLVQRLSLINTFCMAHTFSETPADKGLSVLCNSSCRRELRPSRNSICTYFHEKELLVLTSLFHNANSDYNCECNNDCNCNNDCITTNARVSATQYGRDISWNDRACTLRIFSWKFFVKWVTVTLQQICSILLKWYFPIFWTTFVKNNNVLNVHYY